VAKQPAKPRPETPAASVAEFDDVLRRMLETPPDPKKASKKAGPHKTAPPKPIKRKEEADRG